MFKLCSKFLRKKSKHSEVSVESSDSEASAKHLERLATSTSPVRHGRRPSFDPPMSADDNEEARFNLWKAGGVPDLEVTPPLIRAAGPGGRMRAMTKREAHARFRDEQGDEAYVEFNKQFAKKKEMKEQKTSSAKTTSKKRKASSDDQSRKSKVPRRA